MTYTLKIKDVTLTKATPGAYDQIYKVTFRVVSSIASTVYDATMWVKDELPVAFNAAPLDYSNSGVELKEWNMKALDDNDPKEFEGLATYERKRISGQFPQEGTTGDMDVSFGENTYEKAVWKARDENNMSVAVLNSAGDRFVDPLIEVEKRLVIYIDKMYPWGSWNTSKTAKYFNSVNVNPIRIVDVSIPTRGGIILSLRPVANRRPDGVFEWRVRFEIEVKGHGEIYDREVLDQGFYYLVVDADGEITRGTNSYRRVPILSLDPDDGENKLISEPVLLDGTGSRLTDTTPGNERYITYRTKPEKNWGSLGLPSSLQLALGI